MKAFLLGCLLTLAAAGTAQSIVSKSSPAGLSIEWNGKEILGGGHVGIGDRTIKNEANIIRTVDEDVLLLSIETAQPISFKSNESAGIFFKRMPGFKKGVLLWRYKPWNSWSKPIAVTDPATIPDWDGQFFYWQQEDGTYGAAVPLSGNGYRTTLGSKSAEFGSKAVQGIEHTEGKKIPSLAIAFGPEPFALFERIYRMALKQMGKEENLRVKKSMPDFLNYIGWCSWNASDLGKNLNEAMLLSNIESYTKNNFQLGWVLIDDGWFTSLDGKLQSLEPNSEKFPNGFKPVVDKLKNDYHIRNVGVWHTLNGLWNGIDRESPLGKYYAKDLFSWTQKARPDLATAPSRTYYFIKPESDSLLGFYRHWHKYFRSQHLDFVKVDNQLVVERMALNNYPIFTLSEKMHAALNTSVKENFNGGVINCMDMTADAYLNFGSTAVARTSEDYFPYKPNEDYNLEHGNAAAHIVQAMYNSIYFSQMVYPDFDMFESSSPNGEYHAIARAINNGPIYITDAVGAQKFGILRALVYSDGRTIHSETPLLPTADCLFQLQSPRLFKGFSKVNGSGLLGVWNAADEDEVAGEIKATDIPDLKGEEFLLYDYRTKKGEKVNRSFNKPVKLPRMGYNLFYLIPIANGFAAIGLTDKYNAPATVLKQEWKGKNVSLRFYEGGNFSGYAKTKPSGIRINGQAASFTFEDNMIRVSIPKSADRKDVVVEVEW
jgi:raffinose synthase